MILKKKHFVFQLVVIKCKDLGCLYVEIHVTDYCNEFALCEAKGSEDIEVFFSANFTKYSGRRSLTDVSAL